MMLIQEHQDVRTTLTLDDDVAGKLKSEARRSGRPFRDVVNEFLRRGLNSVRETKPTAPFKVAARDLGEMKPGVSLDSTADLLEQIEGGQHR
jgi:hypothetical protein